MGNKISFDTSRYYTLKSEPKSPQLSELEDKQKPVKKPDMIGTLCKLPATKLHSNTHFHRQRTKGISKDTRCLLRQVSIKLEAVKRKRYIMQQTARIEWCKEGAKLTDLDSIEFYHYSNCPKKYI